MLTPALYFNQIPGHWENVIIDKNGEVWRIDNGSTLRFRACGNMKELRTIVGELFSMRTKTEMMREVFGDINSEEVQNQVKLLLKKKHEIIKYFFKMHQKLDLDSPEFLLKVLVNRIHYFHCNTFIHFFS